MSHGLVEKFFNAYEESIRIPLVFSNPIACTEAQTTQSLASSIDLTPTLASLLGVSQEFTNFDGQDLSQTLTDPMLPVQEFVHFTYDDNAGRGPSIVRTIRTADWKYSVYFNEKGTDADWELYDLINDPDENNNLAGSSNPLIASKQTDMDDKLQKVMKKLGTMPNFHWPPLATVAVPTVPASRGVPQIIPL